MPEQSTPPQELEGSKPSSRRVRSTQPRVIDPRDSQKRLLEPSQKPANHKRDQRKDGGIHEGLTERGTEVAANAPTQRTGKGDINVQHIELKEEHKEGPKRGSRGESKERTRRVGVMA